MRSGRERQQGTRTYTQTVTPTRTFGERPAPFVPIGLRQPSPPPRPRSPTRPVDERVESLEPYGFHPQMRTKNGMTQSHTVWQKQDILDAFVNNAVTLFVQGTGHFLNPDIPVLWYVTSMGKTENIVWGEYIESQDTFTVDARCSTRQADSRRAARIISFRRSRNFWPVTTFTDDKINPKVGGFIKGKDAPITQLNLQENLEVFLNSVEQFGMDQRSVARKLRKLVIKWYTRFIIEEDAEIVKKPDSYQCPSPQACDLPAVNDIDPRTGKERPLSPVEARRYISLGGRKSPDERKLCNAYQHNLWLDL
jgi:hypothetical protein